MDNKMRMGWGKLLIIIAFFWVVIVCPAPVSFQMPNAEAKVEYVGADYRDPLEIPHELRKPVIPSTGGVPGEEGEVKLPTLKVEGMAWETKRPQAIIDGEVYDKGDTVKEAEILDISKDGVTLLYKNRKFIVRPKIEGRPIGR